MIYLDFEVPIIYQLRIVVPRDERGGPMKPLQAACPGYWLKLPQKLGVGEVNCELIVTDKTGRPVYYNALCGVAVAKAYGTYNSFLTLTVFHLEVTPPDS